MSLNHELSGLFRTMSAILEIKGANPFKAIAFSKVSRILKDMTFDIRRCCEEGRLGEIEGIGESSRRIIEEYIRTGRSTEHEDLAASVPAGLLPLLDIPGMGPKTIAVLWKQRNITSLEELIAAIDQGALAGLKGIGEKKIQAIRDGIRLRETASQRMGIGEALPVAEQLLQRLREVPQVKEAQIAGSLRRRRETVGDVDLICALKDGAAGEQVSAAFVKFPEVERVLGQGRTKSSIVTVAGLQVDLRIVPPENYGAAILYFTGSKEHNVKLRGLAQDKGMTLNEWGLYRLEEYDRAEKKTAEAPAAKPVAAKTEEQIYRKLGLPYIEPELREDRGEIEAARKDRLPSLITVADIRGDLHSHTTASDGVATIEQMAEAARARGYECLAITDHSRSQVVANGLPVERLLKHAEQVRQVGKKLKGIKLLAGSEVDILADGRLDYEDAVLAELDFVIASPHVALRQDPQKATGRLLRAIEHRYVNVIGHPTGRHINGREGLPLDFRRIFKAAAETGTALEINAGYPRLDLNEAHARAAIESGVMLSINTDAHSPDAFEEIAFGIGVARRGWVTAKHVINCMTFRSLESFLARKR